METTSLAINKHLRRLWPFELIYEKIGRPLVIGKFAMSCSAVATWEKIPGQKMVKLNERSLFDPVFAFINIPPDERVVFVNRENFVGPPLLPEKENPNHYSRMRLWNDCFSSERLVFGKHGEVYYTLDHYRSFEPLSF